MTTSLPADPDRDCALCPRLHDFIAEWRVREPGWHNAPAATWLPDEGAASVRLLIVGLAPGLRGANRTGRPFTGDFSGDLLYATLVEHGFAEGAFGGRTDDGLRLRQTAITNAVRCVPPQNKPTAAEINTCRPFLSATLRGLPDLQTIVTLGGIAHASTVRAMGARPSEHGFGHGIATEIDGISVISSYHCSRYNVNTGRLTTEMFAQVFAQVRRRLDG